MFHWSVRVLHFLTVFIHHSSIGIFIPRKFPKDRKFSKHKIRKLEPTFSYPRQTFLTEKDFLTIFASVHYYYGCARIKYRINSLQIILLSEGSVCDMR